MNRYIAFVHQGKNGYGISFPDFPGCISGGNTVSEALANGTEALRFHAKGMRADGAAIPEPRSLDKILADPELAEEREGALFTPIPLLPPKGKAVGIQVSIDDQLLAAIDEEARHRGISRSAFLAEAAQLALMPS